MDIRPVRFADLPALTELERDAAVAAAPQAYASAAAFPLAQHLKACEADFRDPWITFTLAEDEQGVAGWIKYTENQLRTLIVADRLRDSGLQAELYAEGYKHWRAASAPRVWHWLLAEDWQARAYFEIQGWLPTGRTRRAALPPHPILAEYLLTLRN